ncbi:MAG: Smr/MutS family protein [Polyangiales bacterium]
MASSRPKSGKGPNPGSAASRSSGADREALGRAFSDVKPLDPASRRRVAGAPPPGSALRRQPAVGVGDKTLQVDCEDNGIITGRRMSTHPSILHSLEDQRLEIDAECDLHGFTAKEAERRVLRFVREAQADGKRWVLIIVGKGLHSPGGKATLRTTIANALGHRAPARYVLAFRTAPRHLGATGAFVARLVDRL